MSWTSGDVINTTARLRRLSSAIPSSYTVFDIGGTIYAESNTAGGSDYRGTDFTTVIQAAIDALPTGGRVHLKGQTTYTETAIVDVKDKIVLTGEGPSTIITQGTNANIRALLANPLDTNVNIVVSDLTLDGNQANQSYGGVQPNQGWGIGAHAGSTQWISKSLFQNLNIINNWGIGIVMHRGNNMIANCLVENNYDGIWLTNSGSMYNTVTGCVVRSNDNNGVVIEDNSVYNAVVGNSIETNGGVGVTLVPAHYNTISGNIIQDNVGKGVVSNFASLGNTIANNIIDTNSDFGISLNAASNYNSIIGNTIRNNDIAGAAGAYGIAIDVSDYTVISANNIYDDQGTPLQEEGIYLSGAKNSVITGNFVSVGAHGVRLLDKVADYCLNNVITGNRLIGIGGNGILEQGNSDYNVIKANNCKDSVTPYTVVGSNNTYDEKIISDAVQINGATTTGVITFVQPAWVARAYLLYETAVANDTNVEVGYGDVGGVDRDKYVASVTSGTGAIWETEPLTLTAAKDVGALDTVTLYQDGSGGAGEYIRLVLDVLYGA